MSEGEEASGSDLPTAVAVPAGQDVSPAAVHSTTAPTATRARADGRPRRAPARDGRPCQIPAHDGRPHHAPAHHNAVRHPAVRRRPIPRHP
ncbi:hypothetical protein ACWDR3_03925 [Streptomyces sp. NPDC001002]